ncbi:hypothetical protein Pth03_65130 [Planotetraspora thailandica]|uniref:SnoaL-like domain-containing protein n=1 Tax=Planotetraspora thailandica TaxID=487172 RepID=A0A8J4DCR2_9ACTN|nr:nuclear transport factor 2 family protein [Planotetraspora thailandica]GII58124.1 hypothetical protein Pth03_65130 [Planotetraspora thailandica]
MSTARYVTDRLFDALNRHDLDTAEQCFGPDAVYINIAGMAEGHDQIRSFYESLLEAYPDLHYKCLTRMSTGDLTMTEWTFTGTHRGVVLGPHGEPIEPTHRRVVLHGCSAGQVEDGLIVNYRVYFNELEHYGQLGLFLRVSDAA